MKIYAVSKKENDEIETIIAKYENHPSILKIKENINVTNEFLFIKPTSESLGKYLISLDVGNDIIILPAYYHPYLNSMKAICIIKS